MRHAAALALAARALAPRPAPSGTAPRALVGFSTTGADTAAATPSPPPPSPSETLRRDLNRLLYRARQRGVLELDIIVGRWADENLGGMDGPARAALADVLAVETPDLLAALLGRAPPPPGLAANPAYAAMAASVEARLAGRGAKTAPGAAWVSGWHDLKTGGNQ